jgi:hypothetical protein
MLWRRYKSLAPARNQIPAIQPVAQIYENDYQLKFYSSINKEQIEFLECMSPFNSELLLSHLSKSLKVKIYLHVTVWL